MNAIRVRDAHGGLAAFVHPVPVSEFTEEHWRRTPLFSHRNERDYFAALPRLADLDLLLATSLHSSVHNRGKLVRSGRDGGYAEEPFRLRADGRLDLHHVFDRYAGGFTVVTNLIELASLPAARLCAALERDTGFRVSVNAYLTPPRSQGFGAHFDSHDVFVVQVDGHKSWRVATEPDPSSAPGIATAADFRSFRDVTLRPGDSLYIPRGYAHSAHTEELSSLHYTFGLSAPTWGQIVAESVESRLQGATSFSEFAPLISDPAARGSSLGALPDPVDAMPTREDLIACQEALRFDLLDRHLSYSGQFVNIDACERLSDISVLERVDNWPISVCRHHSTTQLRLAGRVVEFDTVSPALDFVAAHPRFVVSEVPGNLAENLHICRRLVVEGVLAVQQP